MSKQKSKLSTPKVILRILKDSLNIAPWLALATLLSIGSAFLAMIAPEILGKLTNQIYDLIDKDIPLDKELFNTDTLTLAGAYLLSALLGGATTAVMNYSVSSFFTCKIRVKMSEKIAKIPIKTVDTTPNGEIISRMTNDVSVMGGTVHDIFGIIINGVIKLVMISVIIFTAEPTMAFAVIIFVPISLILSAILASRSEKHFDKSREQSGRLYSLCEENLACFEAVKSFAIEKSQNEKYREVTEKYATLSKKGYFLSGIVGPIVGLINNLSYIVICLIGAYLVIENKVDVGKMVAFIMYAKLFSGPLESIANGMSMIQSAVASAKRVYEYLDGEELTEPGSREITNIRGEVVFKNVYFSYKDNTPLIENLNLTVRPGEKVAIVGPTGGGKTTIVNLLMRFYDPVSGSIFVDGEDIVKMNREDVRKIFGMVLQDTMLFSGSIYDNIAYGRPTATREEVEAAAKAAHIHNFITRLPQGYDTILTDDAANISKGQKQLLTIARAMLMDSPMLILDEATSNVDTRTEMVVQQAMRKLMENKTCFVVAHRLSTIQSADNILVVRDGNVVESGTHDALMEQKGFYWELYQAQFA
jgi:ATP-binding cassette subfamily B protein